jgi:hypothetical protein
MAVFEHYRDQIHSAAHGILVLKAIRTQLEHGGDSSASTAMYEPSFSSAALEVSTEVLNEQTVGPDFNFDCDPFGLDNISDAWFGQQLANLEWLELPEV